MQAATIRFSNRTEAQTAVRGKNSIRRRVQIILVAEGGFFQASNTQPPCCAALLNSEQGSLETCDSLSPTLSEPLKRIRSHTSVTMPATRSGHDFPPLFVISGNSSSNGSLSRRRRKRTSSVAQQLLLASRSTATSTGVTKQSDFCWHC